VSGSDGVMFTPAAGTVDAALLGAGRTFSGQGSLATVRFEAIASGAPDLGVASITARDPQNQAVTVSIAQSPLSVPMVVTETELRPVAPNPARGRATLSYAVAARGPVDLSIFS